MAALHSCAGHRPSLCVVFFFMYVPKRHDRSVRHLSLQYSSSTAVKRAIHRLGARFVGGPVAACATAAIPSDANTRTHPDASHEGARRSKGTAAGGATTAASSSTLVVHVVYLLVQNMKKTHRFHNGSGVPFPTAIQSKLSITNPCRAPPRWRAYHERPRSHVDGVTSHLLGQSVPQAASLSLSRSIRELARNGPPEQSFLNHSREARRRARMNLETHCTSVPSVNACCHYVSSSTRTKWGFR